MNKFLGKKKRDVDLPPATPTASAEQPISAPDPPKERRGWRKKKTPVEEKPQLDLASVLPPSDDFRTSLLMTSLSTRFSMLKEQDDPMSMLGKASDDSVLAPKRRSRLGLTEFNTVPSGLSDIAEVSSIVDPLRPPMLPGRSGSYSIGDGGYSTDDESTHGSIMSRARPGEGNMLFGGRQKVYRIPIGDAGSVSNLGANESRGMRGRALYEDDISLSTFQRLRKEEKERERLEKLAELEREMAIESRSPSFSMYNEKRETTSSTNSGPSIASNTTAQTSQAPSPMPPSTGFSSSSTAPTLERSRSKRLYDRDLDQNMYEQQSANLQRFNSVARSNSLNKGNGVGAQLKEPNKQLRPESPYEVTPPESRSLTPLGDFEPTNPLLQALEPADRMKATAMGHFNKPKKFDEQQFLQRQMSLMKDRKNKDDPGPKSSIESKRRPSDVFTANSAFSKADTLQEDDSENSQKSSPTSERSLGMETARPTAPSRPPPSAPATFLDGDDESEVEKPAEPQPTSPDRGSEGGDGPPVRAPTHRVPPPIFKHPAMRLASQSPSRNKRQGWGPGHIGQSIPSIERPTLVSPASREDLQSTEMNKTETETATEEAKGASTLSGLVREHLRHGSDQSSIYPPKSPAPWDSQPDFDLTIPSKYSSIYQPETSALQTEPGADETLDESAAHVDEDDANPGVSRFRNAINEWEQELRRQHAREGSSETQHERAAFADELAQRQRTIQENLRIKVENESRSPNSGASRLDNSFRPFGMLRQKSSREAMNRGVPGPYRGYPPRGLPQNHSNVSLASHDRSGWDENRGRSMRDHSNGTPPMGRTLHSKMPRPSEEYQIPSKVPSSSRSPSRGRNSNGVGNREQSHTRPSRDQSHPRQNSLINGQDRAGPVRRSPPESIRTSESTHRPSYHSSPPNSRGFTDSTRAYSDASDLVDSKSPSLRAKPSNDLPRLRGDSAHNLNQPQRLNNLPSLQTSSVPSPLVSPTEKLQSPLGSGPAPLPSPLSAASTPVLRSSDSTASLTNSTQTSATSQGTVPHSASAIQTNFVWPPANSSSASSRSKEDRDRSGPFRKQRRPTIQKSDISEPTLINTTNSNDTMDLPSGASLQNGLREDVDTVLLNGGTVGYPVPSPLDRDDSFGKISTGRPFDDVEGDGAAPAPSVPTSSSSNGTQDSKRGFMKGFGRGKSSEDTQRTDPEEDDAAPPPDISRMRQPRTRHQMVGNGGMF